MEEKTQTNQSGWLPGLDTLRFLAAWVVLFGHVEQARSLIGWERLRMPNGKLPYAEQMGADAVSFFFVLSGFLITLLLIRERERNGEIDLKRFYRRRLLRIWPLYFLIFSLSFFVVPFISWLDFEVFADVYDQHTVFRMCCYLFFQPQLSTASITDIAVAGPLWSVGVEEWFYFLWPLGLVFLRKHLLLMIIGGIVIVAIFRELPLGGTWAAYWYYFRINCMCVGAFGAIMVLRMPSVTKVVFSRSVQLVAFGYCFYTLFSDRYHGRYQDYISMVPFAVVIVNVAFNPDVFIKFRWKLTDYLGKISYGIYVYHWLVIIATLNFLHHFSLDNRILSHVLVLAISIGLASLSYHTFESWFLNLRDKKLILKSVRIN